MTSSCLLSSTIADHHPATGAADPDVTLSNLVVTIANQFEIDVCSLYFLEADGVHLVLAATVGLRQQCIGRLRMHSSEGLAGLVAQRRGPVAVKEAARHPRFKYFKDAGEDAYHSFAGVPIVDGPILHGVLVAQTIEPYAFRPSEIRMLSQCASQIVPVVSEIRMLGRFASQQEPAANTP